MPSRETLIPSISDCAAMLPPPIPSPIEAADVERQFFAESPP